jgi:hypothetical protein
MNHTTVMTDEGKSKVTRVNQEIKKSVFGFCLFCPVLQKMSYLAGIKAKKATTTTTTTDI